MATDVAGNLKRVVQSLPPHVRLVAVSKFHPNEELMAAYEQGQRIFGESQEQELSRKAAELPKDIACTSSDTCKPIRLSTSHPTST